MGHERRKPVTLLEVAAKAGVSRMTVSKVLREVGNISDDTRQRVKQAADELGYLPNNLAGSLSSRKSRMVAVIIPSISDIVFSEVLSGVNAVLRPTGFQTFIGESGFDPETETELIRAMLSFRPAGILDHQRHALVDRQRHLVRGVADLERHLVLDVFLDVLDPHAQAAVGLVQHQQDLLGRVFE